MPPTLKSALLILTLGASVCQATDLYSNYVIVPQNVAGSLATYPLGINDSRTISGYYVDGNGLPQAYLWSNGVYSNVALGFPTAIASVAGGIDNQGNIVGTWVDFLGHQHGYFGTPGGPFTSFDVPGAVFSPIDFEFGPGLGTAGIGINSAGVVTGFYVEEAGGQQYVAGYLKTGASYTPIHVAAGGFTDGLGTKLFGINDSGLLAGDFLTQDNTPGAPVNTHGFLFNSGILTDIFVPGSDTGPFEFGTQANGLNNASTVVGVFTDPIFPLGHGLVWSAGQYDTLDIPGAAFTELHAINNRGDITGAYLTDPQTEFGFVAFLPEPDSTFLFGAGLAALGLFGKRRQAKSTASRRFVDLNSISR